MSEVHWCPTCGNLMCDSCGSPMIAIADKTRGSSTQTVFACNKCRMVQAMVKNLKFV